MKHTLALVLAISTLGSVAGCKKNKVKECEDLVALAEKIQKCDKIPEASRTAISSSVSSIKNALKTLEDAGEAPKEQLDMLAKTCQGQVEQVRAQYEKLAPDCLK